MSKIKIGVMGSVSDLGYSEEVERLAFKTGMEIAKMGAVLVFGIEPDADTLPTVAMRGAKTNGGITIGITVGKDKKVYNNDCPEIVICSGLGSDGGREYALAVSCDAIIAIGGGAGTLKEMANAYSADIPLIAIKGTGGWSNKLIGQYMDDRKRLVVIGADNASEAVTIALHKAEKYREKFGIL
ncbi:MAG: hypothetical protein FWG80_03340 [Alphaproteobacteria bacterium]|nr:hypothetical protein [Alphaproteobacteria bacterium]